MRWVTFLFYAVASFFLGLTAYSIGIGYFAAAIAGESGFEAVNNLVLVLTIGAPMLFIGAAWE